MILNLLKGILTFVVFACWCLFILFIGGIVVPAVVWSILSK